MGVDVAGEFAVRIAAAVRTAFDIEMGAEGALVRPAAPGRGADLQANVAMGLGKRLRLAPVQVAQRIVEALDAEDLIDRVSVDGPGFINVRVRADRLGQVAAAIAADERAGVPVDATPKRVVIDYSAPNVAKEMHVGHLRSTIIGDALARVARFGGHEVIAQNHIGDWGTPFGMLIEHMIDEGWDDPGTGEGTHSITDLNGFYQTARAKFDADAAFADRARARVVALQGGDDATLRLWRSLVAESQRHFFEIYRLLGVELGAGDIAGESFYNPMLADVVAELEAKGLTVESDGAVCLFPSGFTNREGEPLPLIVRKRGGGYNYDTTDLAAIRYRTQEVKADDLLYVVGSPQRLHFEMIFAAAREAGWLVEPATARHIGFGSVLGEDGKVLRTRAGASVKLVDLLEEAVERAGAILAERQEIPQDDRPALARAVGIGAVKYADLSSGREKDYTFSFERMLAMEGNTSVYLQYANARIQSVLAKAGQLPGSGTPVRVEHDAERDLILKLAQLGPVLTSVSGLAEPHRLCTWLFETAVAFSSFYENCPILTAEPAVRASRLVLCQAATRALTTGLGLLGIEAPPRL